MSDVNRIFVRRRYLKSASSLTSSFLDEVKTVMLLSAMNEYIARQPTTET